MRQGCACGRPRKAKARAQELLAQVRKAPAEFAEVARKNSQDTRGLLRFGRRPGLLWAWRHGQALRGCSLCDEEGGYQRCRRVRFRLPHHPADRHQGAQAASFEEVRPRIEADLKTQQAQRKVCRVAEAFHEWRLRTVRQPQTGGRKLKLEIKTATGVLRTPAPRRHGPLANGKFLTALFSATMPSRTKRNTEAVETGPSQLAVRPRHPVRAARTLPLDEVRPRVREKLVASPGGRAGPQGGEGQAGGMEICACGQCRHPMPCHRVRVTRPKRAKAGAGCRTAPTRSPAGTGGCGSGCPGLRRVKVNRSSAVLHPTMQIAQQAREQYLPRCGPMQRTRPITRC
jgi:peptidyl-prolyl cis-trans isomerase D